MAASRSRATAGGDRTRRTDQLVRPCGGPSDQRARGVVGPWCDVVLGRRLVVVLAPRCPDTPDDDGALVEHVRERVALGDEVVRVVLREVLLLLPVPQPRREDLLETAHAVTAFPAARAASAAAPTIPAALRSRAGTIGARRSSRGKNWSACFETPPPTTNRSGESRSSSTPKMRCSRSAHTCQLRPSRSSPADA